MSYKAEVPTTLFSGSRNLLEQLTELSGTRYSLDHWFGGDAWGPCGEGPRAPMPCPGAPLAKPPCAHRLEALCTLPGFMEASLYRLC